MRVCAVVVVVVPVCGICRLSYCLSRGSDLSLALLLRDSLSLPLTPRKLGIVMGYYNLVRIFDESYYENLNGGILESFSRLFGSNVKLYIYPTFKSDTETIVTTESFEPEPHLKNLYAYLMDNDKIQDIEGAKTENLHIISDDVLEMIQRGAVGWEQYVPNKVADSIKQNHLFSYPYEVPLDDDDL